MTRIEIKNRWTGAVIYSSDIPDDDPNPLRTAVVRANLTSADLRSILDAAPSEVAGLLAALVEGWIDGSAYEGECACLVGTIANVRGCHYSALPIAADSARPAEHWFLAISIGHTPDNRPIAAITHDWIVEWLAERGEGPLMENS